MPINRAANYHNVAGISQRKEYDVSPMIMLLQCDVKLCQQVKKRGNEPTFCTNQSQIEVNSSTPIKESDKVKACKV
jgi:hypothetical protein